MKAFLIGFIAAVVGLFVGASMNWLLAVNINTSIWPLPEGIDPMDPAQSEALAEWIATLPGQAFILVFVAHVLQAGLGAFVAAAMAKSRTPAVVVIAAQCVGRGGELHQPLGSDSTVDVARVPRVFLAGWDGAPGRVADSGGWASWPASRRSSVRLRIGPKFVLPLGQKLKGFPR